MEGTITKLNVSEWTLPLRYTPLFWECCPGLPPETVLCLLEGPGVSGLHFRRVWGDPEGVLEGSRAVHGRPK